MPPDFCAPQLDMLKVAVATLASALGVLVGTVVFLFYRLEQERTARLLDSQKLLPVLGEGVEVLKDLTTRRSRR
jgi:hypothetical protein